MPQLESGWAGRDTKPDFRKEWGREGRKAAIHSPKMYGYPLCQVLGPEAKKRKWLVQRVTANYY